VSTAETGTRGSRPGELHRRRVVLLAESAGLAAVLSHLLDPADRLSRIGSLRELAQSRSLDSADVVVLDVPAGGRAAAVEQVRQRYLGPLVVLGAKEEPIRGLRPDNGCVLLTRPFSADQLGAALSDPGRPPAAPRQAPPLPWAGAGRPGVAPVRAVWTRTPTTSTGASAPLGTPVPRASSPAAELDLVDRAQRLLLTLTQGWQARRRVRVAGLSAFALVAFTVAFVLAAQGGRCGPGCDAFGTVFSPVPTIASAESRAPSTTGPKRSTTTTAPAGSPATGAFRGITGGGRAGTTTTTQRRTTTTTRKPATTRPATTQSTAPPTTTPPPTTVPETTVTTTGP
jgi:hypothetical protein